MGLKHGLHIKRLPSSWKESVSQYTNHMLAGSTRLCFCIVSGKGALIQTTSAMASFKVSGDIITGKINKPLFEVNDFMPTSCNYTVPNDKKQVSLPRPYSGLVCRTTPGFRIGPDIQIVLHKL